MECKYKLKKNEYGKVNYLLRTGKDLVKSQMNVMAAQHIIDNGKFTKTVDPKYPIAIDDNWFFEGEEITPSSPATPGNVGKGARRK